MKKYTPDRWLPPLLLILAGVLAYWNSFDGVFLYDDLVSIRDNPHIRVLWPLSESMSLPLWSSAATVDGRPLLSFSFALNHHFMGPDPWGYHLVNLLIHIAAGLLLFGVVRRTLDLPRFRERYAHSGTFLAWATAAIWLVHPLQTESVTYIVQRAESLMGMLYLLTMYCAIRVMASSPGPSSGRGPTGAGAEDGVALPAQLTSWHLAAILACAIGMGVKQTMFSAPLLVLLYDGLFVSDSLRSALAKRWRLYTALCATWLIVFGIIGATWQESTSDFGEISPLRYALTQPLVVLYYLRLAIWPSPLALSYGWGLENEWHRIVFPALAILGMLAVTLRGLRHRRGYGFVLAWFFLILAPTSSISPMRQAVFEHRMYLPLAAVVLPGVLAGAAVIGKLVAGPRARAALGGALLTLILVLCGALTHDRNRDYHDTLGMWRQNVTHRPDSALARLNLGNALHALGRFPGAIDQHAQALRIKPNYALAHNNLGNALLLLGQASEAMPHYREALRLKPDLAEAHYNLGNTLQASGRFQQALGHYEQALRLNPDDAEAHNGAGNALLALGQPREAREHYAQAMRLMPDDADVRNNLGSALLTLGQPRAAISHFRESLRLRSGSAVVHYNLGLALEMTGRPHEAIRDFEEALRLTPDFTEARDRLRQARGMLEKGSENDDIP